MIRSRRPAEQRARAQARANAEAQAQAQAQGTVNGHGEAEEDERTEHGRSDDNDDEDDSGSETETEARVTVARKKGESSEERKARKAGVKADRQVSVLCVARLGTMEAQDSLGSRSRRAGMRTMAVKQLGLVGRDNLGKVVV